MRYLFSLIALVSFSLHLTAGRLTISPDIEEEATRNPTTARFVEFLHYYQDKEARWTVLQRINDMTWMKTLIVPKIEEEGAIKNKALMAHFLTTTAVSCIQSPHYGDEDATLFNLVEALDPPTRHFKDMAPVKPLLPVI